MKKMWFGIFVSLAITLILHASLAVATSEYEYKQRSNRMEGLRSIPTSGGGLNLLSFMAYNEALPLADSPELRIRFYLREPGAVYITATELRRQGLAHYHMSPIQTSWGAGWQEFSSWPTTEVMQPLNISIANIGIIAKIGTDRPGSGSVAPVILYGKRCPEKVERYALYLIPTNTLSKVDYFVLRESDGKEVLSRQLKTLAANVPFELSFSLEGQGSGFYRVLINSKELGRTNGPSRQYTFFHRRNLQER